jgi:RNA recognition motif-containing protein
LTEYGCVKGIHLFPESQRGHKCSLAVVEMETSAQEETAIENLNGTLWYDRLLKVNQSQPPLLIQETFKSKPDCLCGSYTLPRHIPLGIIHRRCRHYYQEIPIL